MPTPDPDDAVAVERTPGYVKITMDELRLANEKKPAPQGEDVLIQPNSVPSQTHVTFEQILNALAMVNAGLTSQSKTLALFKADLDAQAGRIDALEAAAAAPATNPQYGVVQDPPADPPAPASPAAPAAAEAPAQPEAAPETAAPAKK